MNLMTTSTSVVETKYEWYTTLVEDISRHGGYIHPSLSTLLNNSNGKECALCCNKLDDCNCTQHSPDRVGRDDQCLGIYAQEDISKDTPLIRIPSKLVISGESFPSHYSSYDDADATTTEPTNRAARVAVSAWLRCVGALLGASSSTGTSVDHPEASSSSRYHHHHHSAYLASLPEGYETLLFSWSDLEVSDYLSGTVLGTLMKEDKASNTFRKQYDKSVRPYLEYCATNKNNNNDKNNNNNILTAEEVDDVRIKDDDDDDGEKGCKRQKLQHPQQQQSLSLYERFQLSCACISTRGFHLNNAKRHSSDNGHTDGSTTVATTPEPTTYSGPYLIPYIDLLNHSSSPRDKCTTLKQIWHRNNTTSYHNNYSTTDDCNNETLSFSMVAERNIRKGEEIVHSYGDELTSAQQLQTFGFVEMRYIQRAIDYALMATKRRQQHHAHNNNNTEAGTVYKQQQQRDGDIEGNHERNTNTMTAATLSKAAIIQACASVASSSYPQQLRKIVAAQNKKDNLLDGAKWGDAVVGGSDDDGDNDEEDVDEVWDIPIDINERNCPSNLNFLSDEITLTHPKKYDTILSDDDRDEDDHDTNGNECVLSDEIVTLCCIQFLPENVYQECLSNDAEIGNTTDAGVCVEDEQKRMKKSQFLSLLPIDVLDDFFLGKLVTRSIVLAIENKVKGYGPLEIDKAPILSLTKMIDNDGRVLDQLVLNSEVGKQGNDRQIKLQMTRKMYGLTICIEEKLSLQTLRRYCLQHSSHLDDDFDMNNEEGSGGGWPDNKDSKTTLSIDERNDDVSKIS